MTSDTPHNLFHLPKSPFFGIEEDRILIGASEVLTIERRKELLSQLHNLSPWRKGPFRVFGIDIDAHWKSGIRFAHAISMMGSIEGKSIADVGAGNGYYSMRLAQMGANVSAYDPSRLFIQQFRFLESLCDMPHIPFVEKGFEDLETNGAKYDIILCLGVLYHLTDPVRLLRTLHHSLLPGGFLLLESLILDMPGSFSLVPEGKIAGIGGVWNIPTKDCLHHWLRRCNFRHIEFGEAYDSFGEMQRTEWADFPLFEDFLDPREPKKTIEGYPTPRRIFVRVSRG